MAISSLIHPILLCVSPQSVWLGDKRLTEETRVQGVWEQWWHATCALETVHPNAQGACKPLILSAPSGQISCSRASVKARQLTIEDGGERIIPEA